MNLVIDLMAIMLQLSLELFETPFNLHFMSYIAFLNTLGSKYKFGGSRSTVHNLPYFYSQKAIGLATGEDGDHPWYDSSNLQWLLLLLCLIFKVCLERIDVGRHNFEGPDL